MSAREKQIVKGMIKEAKRLVDLAQRIGNSQLKAQAIAQADLCKFYVEKWSR